MKQNLQAKSQASTRYRLSLKNFKNAFPLSAVFDSATAFWQQVASFVPQYQGLGRSRRYTGAAPG